MRIALAQIQSIPGKIDTNVEKHLTIIRQIESYELDAVFFPELSLTGYAPQLANDLAMNLKDPVFQSFIEFSERYKILVGVGFPLLSREGVQISMAFFQPKRQPLCYSKVFLHPDEKDYFIPGKKYIKLRIHDEIISPAICYESLLVVHHSKSIRQKGQVYLASVAKSHQAMDKAKSIYATLAKKCKIYVLVVNAWGLSGQFICGGNSGVWTPNENFNHQISSEKEGILIYDTISDISSVL